MIFLYAILEMPIYFWYFIDSIINQELINKNGICETLAHPFSKPLVL